MKPKNRKPGRQGAPGSATHPPGGTEAPPGSPAPHVSPARARATPAEKVNRVEHIVALMTDGEWVRGRSAPVLAEQWGVEVCTVERDAAEASRRVRAAIGDVAELADELIVSQLRIARKAELAGEHRAATAALAEVANMVGAAKPKRVELTGASGRPLGLPPTFAMLLDALDPPATRAELEHYAATPGGDGCDVEGCRMHPGAEGTRILGGG